MKPRTFGAMLLVAAGYIIYRRAVAARAHMARLALLRARAQRMAALVIPPQIMAIEAGDPFVGIDEAGGFQIDSGNGWSTASDAPALDVEVDSRFDLGTSARRDSGDLYGVVTQAAIDTELTASEAEDGFAHATDGETWLEALSASATEYGALPEHVLEIADERVESIDARRDVPIADYGGGGPEGV